MKQIRKTNQDNQILKALQRVEKKLSTEIQTVEKTLSADIEILAVAVKKVESIAQDANRLASESHKLSIRTNRTNNSLQDVKQEVILFKEENHREHVAIKKDSEREHAELRKLLLAGDKGAAELMAEESRDREEAMSNLDQRVGILEKDFGLMRQRLSNTI